MTTPARERERRQDGDGVGRAARERYSRLGATGFLNARHHYEVVTHGRIVFSTTCKRDAENRYYRWCEMVPTDWEVELHKDGAPFLNFNRVGKTQVAA